MMKLVFCLVMLLPLMCIPAYAQTSPVKIAEDVLLNSVYWSADSKSLYFSGENRDWFEYQYDNKNVKYLEHAPFSSLLIGEDIGLINPISDKSGHIPYISFSPDKNFVVYPFDFMKKSSVKVPLAMVDLQTQNITVIPIYVDPFFGIHTDDIFWDEDSTAFVVSNFEGFTYNFYHVSNLKARNLTIKETAKLEIEGETSVVTNFFDISNDGKIVILRYRSGFVLWNPESNNYEIFNFDIAIADVAFVDNNTILYLAKDGLYRLSLEDSQSKLINYDIKGFELYAYFAPNACQIVILDTDGSYGEKNNLYYYELHESACRNFVGLS